MFILNAFSANMLQDMPTTVTFEEVSVEWVKQYAMVVKSAVGHADTASVFSTVLGFEVPMNRTSVVLNKSDEAILGQYSGPRLPEGSTTLPDNAKIRWLHVRVR
jgi:hypothetical protein